MSNHFFAYLYRLKLINRWGLMRATQPENVAEHTFQVAALAHVLCTIANEVYNKNVPTDRVVSLAILHDLEEVLISDIPTPIKHANPRISKNFRELEQLSASRLVGMLPQELQKTYEPLLLNPDSDLKYWVKAADKLDAYLKCVTEVAAGNKEFAVAKKQTKQALDELHMMEIDYFLEHFAASFEMSLDELS